MWWMDKFSEWINLEFFDLYIWSWGILVVIKRLSSESHTGEFLAKTIEEIIEKIGPAKFSGLVTDSEANIWSACKDAQRSYSVRLGPTWSVFRDGPDRLRSFSTVGPKRPDKDHYRSYISVFLFLLKFLNKMNVNKHFIMKINKRHPHTQLTFRSKWSILNSFRLWDLKKPSLQKRIKKNIG